MNADSISLIIALFSLVGTIAVAVLNVRSAQMQASDKIATGSSALIDELQDARKRDKERIAELESENKKLADEILRLRGKQNGK